MTVATENNLLSSKHHLLFGKILQILPLKMRLLGTLRSRVYGKWFLRLRCLVLLSKWLQSFASVLGRMVLSMIHGLIILVGIDYWQCLINLN